MAAEQLKFPKEVSAHTVAEVKLLTIKDTKCAYCGSGKVAMYQKEQVCILRQWCSCYLPKGGMSAFYGCGTVAIY